MIVVISYPHYFKSEAVHFCMLDESRTICVTEREVTTHSTKIVLKMYSKYIPTEITPAEFKEAFETTLEKLTAMLPE